MPSAYCLVPSRRSLWPLISDLWLLDLRFERVRRWRTTWTFDRHRAWRRSPVRDSFCAFGTGLLKSLTQCLEIGLAFPSFNNSAHEATLSRKDSYIEAEIDWLPFVGETHPIGRWKAKFFRALGFNETNVNLLSDGFGKIAQSEDVVEVTSSPHGTKYVIEGSLLTPEGDQVYVKTVWIIDKDQDLPRFVTAYPSEKT